eukprot:CAMPEP_0115865020 /NCGR_PEP_ID=MMETSP0287-20121206/19500_1 /TAXON_ID=412157 /ORGANISM="Chrysochromulina rotalis, Strain UIO044" /LENGTH=105 /DNA_ID=CAMNT_0003319507 /DNA_START=15 /DNA_END=332 /DNA_ORIENTATION=+
MCALMHKPDELVTFAGPRVGNAKFAAHFDRTLGKETTTHLVHDLDPVIAQNQPLWDFLGFVHTGQLVRCSASKPRFLLPNEAREGFPLNFEDHAHYMGTFMGPRL